MLCMYASAAIQKNAFAKDWGRLWCRCDLFPYNQDSVKVVVADLKRNIKPGDRYSQLCQGAPNNFGIFKMPWSWLPGNKPMPSPLFLEIPTPSKLVQCKNLVACWRWWDRFQQTAADLLQGKDQCKGKLPVTILMNINLKRHCKHQFFLPPTAQKEAGFNPEKLVLSIQS